MATPGIGDPYWFEWYVGLKNIINMLNPDNGIEYVIFQCSKYNTIDDVVVGYKDGGHEICYQIKHEIFTSRANEKIFIEDVYSILGAESEPDLSPHRLAPPFPFFESRKAFSARLEKQLRETNHVLLLLNLKRKEQFSWQHPSEIAGQRP